MNDLDDELTQLLEEAVIRLSTYRQTFTEEEALQPVWEQGYDLSPQSDPQGRFVLVYEADGKHPRQWRLSTQALANNRLLDELRSGTWNGRDLAAELARLDAEDDTHYIFCPYDPRLSMLSDGTLEPADSEYNLALPQETKATLDALGPALLEHWHSSGNEPWTVPHVTEQLGKLGWSQASTSNGWLLVRAWLLSWPEAARVGQDYWLPSNSVPKGPERTRLQVLPVGDTSPIAEAQYAEASTNGRPVSPGQDTMPTIENSPILQGKPVLSNQVSWTYPLRTIHLLEGFLPVPATARSAYPPRGIGEGDREVLRGLWYDNDERLWLWLDRTQNRLYGPDLAHKLEWLEAGDLLRIQWTPNVIALSKTGHNDEVQREEERLVDPQALQALRGGLGETYRQSIQAILSEYPEGLTFPQLVNALRERQGHDVARNTVRVLLYVGGFIQRNSCWFAAPQSELGARRLRVALVETLVPVEETEQTQTTEDELTADGGRRRRRVEAIRARLEELVNTLRKSSSTLRQRNIHDRDH